MPEDYPSQDEFNDYLDANGLDKVTCHRPGLYHELCQTKWHQWNKQGHRWIPIRDWKAYVSALNQKMAEAFEQ